MKYIARPAELPTLVAHKVDEVVRRIIAQQAVEKEPKDKTSLLSQTRE